jgi:two-component system CheB/CheR fusion protein
VAHCSWRRTRSDEATANEQLDMTNKAETQSPELPAMPAEATDDRDDSGEGAAFPVVGVGASAGGLEALTQLIKALPADTGMGFVLVQHLAPTHASAMAEILTRVTTMPVVEVQDDLPVEPNHIYVIPPGRGMIIAQGVLQLLPRESGLHRPVDQFFRSLATDRHHEAIGVVLSGTATDGTLGLEAIKGEGGITFAQDATAQHEGMPHSAIASGCVDFVLPPDGIAQELVRISRHQYSVQVAKVRKPEDESSFAQVVQLLFNSTGVDFTHYKFNTLFRRVTRRMVFRKLDTLPEYVQYLRETPDEADALYQDILISVTSFFRDKESFEALKSKVFPRLLKDRSRHEPVRIWTLGCSTGQEAYSLAMAFAEAAEAAGSSVPLQLFATDLNPAAIEKARAGAYPRDIAQEVSPERLRRFFTDVDGSYRISKKIRDACVFSRHNVLTDPPFSRMDLISCRNLLIYLEPVLQKRVLPTLHYALKPGGYLWLGASEAIGAYRKLFDADDAKHKIYAKKPVAGPGPGHFPLRHDGVSRPPFTPIATRTVDGADLHREADRLLSTRYSPPAALVTTELDILQYRGDTSPYLAPAPGKASLNLLKMLREGLLVGVRAAVLRAGKEGASVREEGLRVKSDEGSREVAIEVIPIKGGGSKESGFLILFEDARARREAEAPAGTQGSENAQGTSPPQTAPPDSPDSENARLAQELSATRDYLQALFEQQEAANEELQSANEEVQSANEELQSTNEELETSKEEIQSSNEELATVNDELSNRNTELHRVNNDLVNLLGSVQMAIVMLGRDLRVRRFTPMAEKLFNLIPSDLGRPLADIKLNLDGLPDLEPLLTEVLDTVNTHERDVRDSHGRWYSLRLRPYRTLDNTIDGVVVMLVDMTDHKRAEAIVQTQNDRLALLWEAAGVLLATDDPNAMVRELFARISPSLGADVYFNHMVDDTGGVLRLASYAGVPEESVPSFEQMEFGEDIAGTVAMSRKSLVATHIQQSVEPRFQLARSFGLRTYACNPLMSGDQLLGTLSFASRTRDQFDPDELAMLTALSHYAAVAYERLRLLSKLQEADQRKNEFLALLAHEIRNPLAPISNALRIMKTRDRNEAPFASASAIMERQVGHLVRLVDDLIDVSRISLGKVDLRTERVELVLAVNHAVEDARVLFNNMKQDLSVVVPPQPVYLNADPTRLTQVLGNLLSNACKYTGKGGRILIAVERDGEQAVIRVRDNGIGLSADQKAGIFEMFVQVDTSPERSGSGLGLGLTLVRTLVEMHGGTVEVHSAGLGQGSEFVVRLPIMSATGSPPLLEPGEDTQMPTATRRILVVDDNPDAVMSLAILLEQSGNEIQTAQDGLEAVAAAETFRPDIVLLDLGLPKLNGYDTARRIREQPWGKTMLLVAMTGWGQPEDRRKSAEAGFNLHLVKPVNQDVLMKLLAGTEPGAPRRGE